MCCCSELKRQLSSNVSALVRFSTAMAPRDLLRKRDSEEREPFLLLPRPSSGIPRGERVEEESEDGSVGAELLTTLAAASGDGPDSEVLAAVAAGAAPAAAAAGGPLAEPLRGVGLVELAEEVVVDEVLVEEAVEVLESVVTNDDEKNLDTVRVGDTVEEGIDRFGVELMPMPESHRWFQIVTDDGLGCVRSITTGVVLELGVVRLGVVSDAAVVFDAVAVLDVVTLGIGLDGVVVDNALDDPLVERECGCTRVMVGIGTAPVTGGISESITMIAFDSEPKDRCAVVAASLALLLLLFFSSAKAAARLKALTKSPCVKKLCASCLDLKDLNTAPEYPVTCCEHSFHDV